MAKIAKEYLKVFHFIEKMSEAEQSSFEQDKKMQAYFKLYMRIKEMIAEAVSKEDTIKYEVLVQHFQGQDFRHLLRNLWKKLLENADIFYTQNPINQAEADCAKLLLRVEYLLVKQFREEALTTLKKARTLAVKHNLYTQFAKIHELSEKMWTLKIISPLENQDWYQTFIEASMFALDWFKEEKAESQKKFANFVKTAISREFKQNWREEQKIEEFRNITYALKQAYTEELPNRDILEKKDKMNFYEIYFAQYIRQGDKDNLLRVFDNFLQEEYDFVVQKDRFFSIELMYWQTYIFWFSQKEGYSELAQTAYNNLLEFWQAGISQGNQQHTALALFWHQELKEMKEVLLWNHDALCMKEKIEVLKKVSSEDFENFEDTLVEEHILEAMVQKLKLYFLLSLGADRTQAIQKFEGFWSKMWHHKDLKISSTLEADILLMKAVLMLMQQEDLDSVLRRLDYLFKEKEAINPFREAMRKYLKVWEKNWNAPEFDFEKLHQIAENSLEKILITFLKNAVQGF